jgi:glycosyltransferase involved in cell wall biosynthesis
MVNAPKRILFLDITCPVPYDAKTLMESPLGGTEATVIRIAEGLAAKGHRVWVAQHNRADVSDHGLATYTNFDLLGDISFDAVVALRSTKLLPFIRKTYPLAKKFLWLHDFNQQDLIRDFPLLPGFKILGVSRTHKTAIIDSILTQITKYEGVTVDFVYNPIDDGLLPNSTPVDENKLVFFSSPHKGLEHTIEVFRKVRKNIKGLKLYLANPGYLIQKITTPKGVTNLGPLPHLDIVRHVRESFAVLHLNPVFAETFGLVHAEAGAVGTPCLTSGLGANAEILSPNRDQMIDVRDVKAVTERLLKWKQQRPVVECKPEFRLKNVLTKWESLL